MGLAEDVKVAEVLDSRGGEVVLCVLGHVDGDDQEASFDFHDHVVYTKDENKDAIPLFLNVSLQVTKNVIKIRKKVPKQSTIIVSPHR